MLVDAISEVNILTGRHIDLVLAEKQRISWLRVEIVVVVLKKSVEEIDVGRGWGVYKSVSTLSARVYSLEDLRW